MRAMPIVALVIALGLVLSMFAMLGVTDLMNGPDTVLEDEVEQTANDSENVDVDPDEAGEGGFLSFTVSGVRAVMGIMYTAVFLPSTLRTLGFPNAFATFAGHGAQIVVAVGLVQVIIGNEVR